ncbi:MAG: class I SAM-dependent RNA methyltransferase [bacterium]
MSNPSNIVVTCSRGVAPFLRSELQALGFPILSEKDAAVQTRGSFEDCLRLNLYLRTAQAVLFEIGAFRAGTPDELYKGIACIAWEGLLFQDGYVCVTSTVLTDAVRDPRFATLKCKDAIVDRMVKVVGSRPDSGSDRDKAVVHLHWDVSQAQVYIDTSGESLSRRNYRKNPWQAPMQESLAATCVLASGWTGQGNFVNPMCGSGTLAIEAALIALGRAPGLLRKNYGFMHIKGYREKTWKELCRSAQETRKAPAGKIIASDINPKAIEAARNNATNAGVDQAIEFSVCDFMQTTVPPDGGVVMFNPDYGERRGSDKNLEPMYKGIGDFMKQKCEGYKGYVFTGNLALAKKIGLRSSRRIQLFNSNIECRLLEFELYAGTRDP